MKNFKRLSFYVILNIIVSALTMWGIFSWGMKKYPDLNPVIPTAINSFSPSEIDITPTNESNFSSILANQLEISIVIGAGDLATERVLIKHIGEEEINLSGWKLADQEGNQFTFPILTLFSGAAVSVNSRSGVLTVIDLFWGMSEPVWSIGETVVLLDPAGNTYAQYSIP